MNVLFLTTLTTLKACNSSYMKYYFKRFFVLHSSEVIFSFLIKKSRQNATEIEIPFLSFPWKSEESHVGLLTSAHACAEVKALHRFVQFLDFRFVQFLDFRDFCSF